MATSTENNWKMAKPTGGDTGKAPKSPTTTTRLPTEAGPAPGPKPSSNAARKDRDDCLGQFGGLLDSDGQNHVRFGPQTDPTTASSRDTCPPPSVAPIPAVASASPTLPAATCPPGLATSDRHARSTVVAPRFRLPVLGDARRTGRTRHRRLLRSGTHSVDEFILNDAEAILSLDQKDALWLGPSFAPHRTPDPQILDCDLEALRRRIDLTILFAGGYYQIQNQLQK